MPTNRYYHDFQGKTFVVQAEAEAVERPETTAAVLRGIKDLLDHDIRVALVFGKGARFGDELRTALGARPHPETNRLVIPETALPRIQQKRAGIADAFRGLCREYEVPCEVLDASAVRAERRIGHGSTGVVTAFDLLAVRAVLGDRRLAILGFGGEDDRGRFLQVPSVSLAAELAVELAAQKLLYLTETDGVLLPDARGEARLLSFADLDGLLCLLSRKDRGGNLVLAGEVVPKIHASIRAVGGGVGQVHLVSCLRLLEEIVTRTGVGTMIERRQSHHVDDARPEDLAEIERLQEESQRYTSDAGTPYVKPLDRSDLKRLLPQTLLLKHRGIVIGKLHTTEIPGVPQALQIGGFVIGENHQDSQQGQLLLGEAFGRLRERGVAAAVAITASPRAKGLFARCGGRTEQDDGWKSRLLKGAQQRYPPEERSQVQLFEFPLA
jgi:amino-acid N-acetyltransferase